MYHDFLGREIEDLEGDNMRRDTVESLKEQPGPVLLIYPCSEQEQHGGDCWNVKERGGDVVSPHVTYTAAYMQVYGTEPPPFDPFCDTDDF